MMDQHDAPDPQHAPHRMVLFPIVKDRPLLSDSKTDRKRRRRLAPVVDGTCPWIKDSLPTGIPRATAPVHIVAIHEQTLIEESHLVKGLSTNHRETTDNHIYGKRAVVWEVEHVLAGKKTRTFEYAFQPRCGTKVVPQGRESSAGALLRHIRIENAGADVPDF